MRRGLPGSSEDDVRVGCGPLITPWSEQMRPLRQQVFDRVRASGLVARVQLAKDLGVSPASVTTMTSELIEAGLIEEVAVPRDTESGRGRPAVALGVRGAAHYVVGMKLSDREHTAVVVDMAGTMLADAAIAREPGPSTLAAMLDAGRTSAGSSCAKAGLDRGDLSAVGIGVPGFVDHTEGMVHWSSTLIERAVPLAAAAQDRIGLPVTIDNDANLVALAELWFGAGRALADFAVVTIEHGVGMGFVMNHRIYRGAQRLGLELGHTKGTTRRRLVPLRSAWLSGGLCCRLCLGARGGDGAEPQPQPDPVDAGAAGKPLSARQGRQRHGAQHLPQGGPLSGDGAGQCGEPVRSGSDHPVGRADEIRLPLRRRNPRRDAGSGDQLGPPRPPIEIHAWGDLLWAHGAAALALSAVTEKALSVQRDIAAQ